MAYSGTVSLTNFNVLRVCETAYRRCRLPAQAITSEMLEYARQSLHLLLSRLPNPRDLTWCIERVVLPMYVGQPAVEMPLGTVSVRNANYRTISPVAIAVETPAASTYTLQFTTAVTLNTIGAIYDGTTTALTLERSDDGVSWSAVAGVTLAAGSNGETVWADIVPAATAQYFRLSGTAPTFNVASVIPGNNLSEVPFGMLNQDTYTALPNKMQQGRPAIAWFQRDIPQPLLNVWPAPNDTAATQAQVVVWYQRHIMDVGTLRDDLEVPQRWLDAVIWLLARDVALETPAVDIGVLPLLEARATAAQMEAYDGDSDGAPTYITPQIGGYTR